MKTLLLAVALAAGHTAAPPAGDLFCEDIRALARGAEEAQPFRSLVARDFRPRLGRADCFFSDAGSYTCGHNLALPEETADYYAGRIQTCLPGSVRTTTSEYMQRYQTVRLGRFQARVTEHGADRAHVGRSIDIYLESVDPAKAGAEGS